MRLSNTVFIKAQRPPKVRVVAGWEGFCKAGRLLRKPVGALQGGPGRGQRALLTRMEQSASGSRRSAEPAHVCGLPAKREPTLPYGRHKRVKVALLSM